MQQAVSFRKHKRSRGLPLWVLWVSGLAVILIAVGFTVILRDILAKESPSAPGSGYSLGANPATATTPTAVATTPSASLLVANARKVKPLEDITKGDRVIYQEHVCTWQEWDGNISISTIKCGAEIFEIQTGRLTPVELKDGPSALKVRHS